MRSDKPIRDLHRAAWVLLGLVSSLSAQDSADRNYADQLPRIPATEALSAVTALELADPQLKVELIAAEPMVMDPVAITFDEWGRALVVEMRGYSERADQRLGRIRLLEDQDQDGRFDRATTFVEGLRWPTGICCFHGGILVADAPEILFFKDEDGDGQADVRRSLLTGFGTSNVQQLPNNIQWTIDNQIVGASGGNGGQLRRVEPLALAGFQDIPPQENLPLEIRGRDFSIDPLTLKLSVIAGGTQFGMALDRWGNRFVCSNSDHCQQVIFEDRYAARNPLQRVNRSRISIATDGAAAEVFRISPVEPWRKVRTRLRVQGLVRGPVEGGGRAAGYFTSATGLTAYDGDRMPQAYLGNLFVGDVGSNLVHRKQLVGDGIEQQAFRSEQGTEFLRSPDNWFRPVQMANAPDGSLVILDMYRETIEHPASLPPIIKQHLDLNSGNQRGRIYRVLDRTAPGEPRQLPGNASLDQLGEMLEHANGWHRRTAARVLLEKAQQAAPDVREGIAEQLQVRLARSKHPEARIRAMYLLASLGQLQADEIVRSTRDPIPQVRVHAIRASEAWLNGELENQLLTMVDDPDIRVRFQLALTLGELQRDPTDQIVRLAAADGLDAWMQTALASSASRIRGSVLESLAREIVRQPAATNACRPLLLELVRQLIREPTDADLTALKNTTLLLPRDNRLLLGEFLAEVMRMSPAQLARFRTKLGGADDEWTSLVQSIVEEAGAAAIDASLPVEQRARAIALLRMEQPAVLLPLVRLLLQLNQAPAVRDAAIDLVGKVDDGQLGGVLLEQLPTLNPAQRSVAFQTLLSRPTWTKLMMADIAAAKISPALLEAAVKQRLLRHANPDIAQQATTMFGNLQDADRERLVQQYLAGIDQWSPVIDRGRTLFRKSCMTCHRLEGEGNEIGPNLAAFANRGAASMITNILDPNREVDPRYLAYQVVVEDGRLLTGVIESETETSITLKDAQGVSVPLLRAEIEAMQSTTLSLMPDNFGTEFSPQQMSDLVGYLLSQGE